MGYGDPQEKSLTAATPRARWPLRRAAVRAALVAVVAVVLAGFASPLALGLEKPAVTAVAPSSGPEGGKTSVTITGTGFTEASTVEFGSSKATGVEFVSSTSIKAISPEHAAGPVEVTVTTAGGTSATSGADTFTYIAKPTVTAVAPSSGPEGGKTSVTITGTGFTEASTVEFGSSKATGVEFVSSTSIKAISPEHAAGPVEVTVTTAGGTSATSGADTFTYVPPPPTVTAVEPGTGPPSGGTSVTITGTNLTAATVVRFGPNVATFFRVESSTSIVATAPAGIGKVDVVVTTPGGVSPTSAQDAFEYVAPPTEGPPKPKEAPPPPSPPPSPPPPPGPVRMAKCTLMPIFLTLERRRTGKAKPRVVGGALQVMVTCDASASVRLAGRLGVLVKRTRSGKGRTKVYLLGPSAATVSKGVAKPITLRLPLATIHALVAKARESARITLAATDGGGTSHNAVRIKQLRA